MTKNASKHLYALLVDKNTEVVDKEGQPTPASVMLLPHPDLLKFVTIGDESEKGVSFSTEQFIMGGKLETTTDIDAAIDTYNKVTALKESDPEQFKTSIRAVPYMFETKEAADDAREELYALQSIYYNSLLEYLKEDTILSSIGVVDLYTLYDKLKDGEHTLSEIKADLLKLQPEDD